MGRGSECPVHQLPFGNPHRRPARTVCCMTTWRTWRWNPSRLPGDHLPCLAVIIIMMMSHCQTQIWSLPQILTLLTWLETFLWHIRNTSPVAPSWEPKTCVKSFHLPEWPWLHAGQGSQRTLRSTSPTMAGTHWTLGCGPNFSISFVPWTRKCSFYLRLVPCSRHWQGMYVVFTGTHRISLNQMVCSRLYDGSLSYLDVLITPYDNIPAVFDSASL
jgi:hypothetical protein